MFVMPVLWIALHVYMDRRLVHGSALGKGGKRVARGLIVVAAFCQSSRCLGDSAVAAIAQPLYMPGFFSRIRRSCWCCWSQSTSSARACGLRSCAARVWPRPEEPTVDAVVADSSPRSRTWASSARRRCRGIGILQIDRTPAVLEVDVPIANCPLRRGVSHRADDEVHVGPTVRGEYLDRCVEGVQRPDATSSPSPVI